MTSFRMGWHLRLAGASFAGLLAMTGCDPDTEDSGGDTMSVTTGMTMTGTDSAESTAEGGSGDDTSGGQTELSHAADIQPIWDEHCVDACHSSEAGAEWSFLDMSEGEAYGALVGPMSTQATDLSFIEPGDVDASYLWHKINGTQADAGGGGLDMPKARADGSMTMLTQEQLDTIEAWIMGGAPE